MFSNMFQKIKNLYRTILKIETIEKYEILINDLKIQNGNILTLLQQNILQECKKDIKKAEFKVFSQWGDDGIIQFLINYLDIEESTFIEFGVENYKEANTRYLLINNNWKGLIIDGSTENIQSIKNEDIYWKHDLTVVGKFITKENINQIISSNGFNGEIGILHIDIDGNDYWIWNEITVVNPAIVIVEYNSTFGDSNFWTIPYIEDFVWTNYHHSNLYYGASVPAFCDLADKKGYCFIGCNSNGNNAYFVRKDKVKDIQIKSAKDGYVQSRFRDSRDKNGQLTFACSDKKIQFIKGLEIYNTKENKIEKI